MNIVDAIGYLAAALVLATFCMRDMRRLRWLAIASNLAFIAYAVLADLAPVLVLHLLLLPVNVQRLMAWRSTAAAHHTHCKVKETCS
jgi:CRP/FNR family cyclic AMP-dependent transcriptional regulator